MNKMIKLIATLTFSTFVLASSTADSAATQGQAQASISKDSLLVTVGTYTGPVKFAIKLRNELAGTAEVTLYTGRINVAKVHQGAVVPSTANNYVYYVDHDWTLPIGYVYYYAQIERT